LKLSNAVSTAFFISADSLSSVRIGGAALIEQLLGSYDTARPRVERTGRIA
jgi:hypothetical protein